MDNQNNEKAESKRNSSQGGTLRLHVIEAKLVGNT